MKSPEQTIQQLWYTATPFGLSGSPGWQVRAASPALADLSSARFQRLSGLLRYELPVGARPTNITPAQAPLSLGFYTVDGKRILVQRTFTGLTWDRRPGNYFSHLLADLPPDFTARDAIGCWKGSFWRSSDTLDSCETTLPTLHRAELKPGPLTRKAALDAQLSALLTDLLVAFLMRRPDQRIYIVAPPDEVAVLIWGLTRALPALMLDDLTFSTFERELVNPLGPLITGICPAPGHAPTDTLVAGVAPGAVIIDLLRQRSTGVPNSPGVRNYAATAVRLLAKGSTVLNALFARIERHRIQDPEALLELLRFFGGDPDYASGRPTRLLFQLLEQHPELFLVDVLQDQLSTMLIQTYLNQFSYANLARESATAFLELILPNIPRRSEYHLKVTSWLELMRFLRSPVIQPDMANILTFNLSDIPKHDLDAARPAITRALIQAMKTPAQVAECIRCLHKLYKAETAGALANLFEAACELGRQPNHYEGLCLVTHFTCSQVASSAGGGAAHAEIYQLLWRQICSFDSAVAQAVDADTINWNSEGRQIWAHLYQQLKDIQQREAPTGVLGRLRSLFGSGPRTK